MSSPNNMSSILTDYDDMMGRYNFLINNLSVTEEFERFVAQSEEARIRWLATIKENEHLKDQLRETQNEIRSMEQRHDLIRQMLDKEKARRIKSEKELEQKVNTINTFLTQVMDPVVNDETAKISEETKMQISEVKNSFRRERPSTYIDHNARLSTVREGDTTSSMLSDVSYSLSEDISEDNIIDEPVVLRRSSRNKSGGYRTSAGASDFFSRSNEVRLRRSGNIRNVDLNAGDQMTATSSVVIDKHGIASASASVDISSPPRKSGRRMSQVIVPSIHTMPPSAPSGPSSTTTSNNDSIEDFLSATNANDDEQLPYGLSPKAAMQAVDQIHGRMHSTVSHKCIMPSLCAVCNKRMHYTHSTVKCTFCKAVIHTNCETLLPLPCVPLGPQTPSQTKKKPHMNILVSYTPEESPMIPPLVIHCVVEVEKRGLTEEGIYRISGNKQHVRDLKKDLLSKETTYTTQQKLSNADIHTVCSALKDFLINLDEPVVPQSMWDWFTSAVSSGDNDDIKVNLIAAVQALPPPNKETLAYIMMHLQRVAEANANTKMSHQSLSIIFGPCLIGFSSKEPQKSCTEIDIINKTVYHLLNMDFYFWNSLIAEQVASNIPTTPPASYRAVCHTPSTDSLVYRLGRRTNKTTPMLTRTERKKKYFKTPPYYKNQS